jgi:hypothetical protein
MTKPRNLSVLQETEGRMHMDVNTKALRTWMYLLEGPLAIHDNPTFKACDPEDPQTISGEIDG